jgi:hypothetical protein
VEPWGWKDPRTSLTAPFWAQRLAGLRFVVCVRNPLEVAASLRARGYTSTHFGLRLWETYHRALDAAVPPGSALATHYDSYFSDARQEVGRVLDFLDLRASDALRQAAAASASLSARHQRRVASDLAAPGLSQEGALLYASLCARSGPVYARVQAAAPPAAEATDDTSDASGPRRSPSEREGELLALLAARDEEIAALKPVLAARDEELASMRPVLEAWGAELGALRSVLEARDEELASIKPVLAARDEELASIKPVLAAREEELASVKSVLAARDEELASIRPVLAARDAELAALKAGATHLG